ncbi:MAG TPA: pyruvate, phosphate dikinase [Candidatus Deferrimicrobiaceae bacterium]|nr:pyruvate, phosphate dikinase [Candidatus Deferrimicrobiaceae bacterium]
MPYVYDCDSPPGGSLHELTALMGGKAANLTVMSRDLGLPVPPAFTITTAACREYLANGWPAGLDAELRQHMARMEALVGRRFGDPADPLLVSVRSGAPVSMPGMMDTILNLGLNDATTAGLAKASGSPAFAANCRSRFEAMYRDIVGEAAPDDPWAQLRSAVEAVFRSWNSDRARAFRRREGIPDVHGTAVTVQAMVYGNRSVDSGTGVLFTRNPASGVPELYGDFLFNAQGEDVVSGTHATEPISIIDERMPEVGRQLRAAVDRLERHHRDLCDIEFTVEHGRLWLLQCRIGKRSPLAALRIAIDMAEDPSFELTRAEAVERVRDLLANPPTVQAKRPASGPPIASGLPASPGVAAGEVVVEPNAAVAAADAGRKVVLVRSETSPDDVHGMAASVGILTASGGLASHAAVVARGWGIPAVVGAAGIRLDGDGFTCDGRRFAVGDTITVDGGTGEVFAGVVAGEITVAPEAAILLEWARELGIEVGEASAAPNESVPAGEPGEAAGSGEALAEDAVLTVLLVKGYASADAVAAALLAPPDAAMAALDGLLATGLAEEAVGSVRLTDAGKRAAHEAVERTAAAWGRPAAEAALDTFLDLDARMKATVTAWQLREVGGEQIINDHTDAAYDGRVLADLAALHGDAAAWLEPLVGGLPRLATYVTRLEHANAAAQAGDGRFVASPRVDSYHSVWFELHEDLILHAGRTRADEVAAGRA